MIMGAGWPFFMAHHQVLDQKGYSKKGRENCWPRRIGKTVHSDDKGRQKSAPFFPTCI